MSMVEAIDAINHNKCKIDALTSKVFENTEKLQKLEECAEKNLTPEELEKFREAVKQFAIKPKV